VKVDDASERIHHGYRRGEGKVWEYRKFKATFYANAALQSDPTPPAGGRISKSPFLPRDPAA
jgi:hypothetical protein